MSVETYIINPNLEERKLEVIVGNEMTIADAVRYGYELNYIIKRIDTTQFVLEVDCRQMDTLLPKIAKSLVNYIEFYKEIEFKYINFIINSDPSFKMQLSKIFSQVGLKNYTFIVDEIA